jgi:hypothetical protein
MPHSSRRRPPLAGNAGLADLRACPACGGLVDGAMTICPTCRGWLGPGSPALWGSLVIGGGLLITAAFFLPWLTGVDLARDHLLSGYDLARIAERLATTAVGQRPTAAASLALYMVPAAGLALVGLMAATPLLRLNLPVVGRLLVGLAAIPCQLALLAALFALGAAGDGRVTGWPHVGPVAAGLGGLLAIVGGIALGGQGRLARLPRPAGRPLADRS